MSLTDPSTGNVTDAALAALVANQAGAVLVSLRAELGFDDVDALRAAGDRRSHALISAMLQRWRPADRVLSEEGYDDRARHTADRVWIVDPLDGTREFGEPGRVDWAVHVALWAGGRLAAGAIALPAQALVMHSGNPPAVPAPAGGPVRLAASRTRPPAFLLDLAERIGAVVVPMGSAGAKIAAVLTGAADAYVHAGGQYEWDSAAPVAVALAAGLHASRIDGNPLEYNRPDARLPDLMVCRRDLAGQLLYQLRQLGAGPSER